MPRGPKISGNDLLRQISGEIKSFGARISRFEYFMGRPGPITIEKLGILFRANYEKSPTLPRKLFFEFRPKITAELFIDNEYATPTFT
jgi:hypothetical protein